MIEQIAGKKACQKNLKVFVNTTIHSSLACGQTEDYVNHLHQDNKSSKGKEGGQQMCHDICMPVAAFDNNRANPSNFFLITKGQIRQTSF